MLLSVLKYLNENFYAVFNVEKFLLLTSNYNCLPKNRKWIQDFADHSEEEAQAFLFIQEVEA